MDKLKILIVAGAMDVGVEFFSLSKSFNVTGGRISFLIGRSDVVSAFRKLRSQIDFGMFLPLQYAAIAALRGPLDTVKKQNKFLWGAFVFSILLTVCVVFIPGVNTVFGFEPISLTEFAIAIGLAVLVIPFAEISKVIANAIRKRKDK